MKNEQFSVELLQKCCKANSVFMVKTGWNPCKCNWYYLSWRGHHDRVMQLNWLCFCGICQMMPLNVWLNTALGCNHQSICMPQLQPLCSAAQVPNVLKMYYPERMKAWVSPVQWSKPYNIFAPTQDSNPGGRIQNYKRWPLHYYCMCWRSLWSAREVLMYYSGVTKTLICSVRWSSLSCLTDYWHPLWQRLDWLSDCHWLLVYCSLKAGFIEVQIQLQLKRFPDSSISNPPLVIIENSKNSLQNRQLPDGNFSTNGRVNSCRPSTKVSCLSSVPWRKNPTLA